MRREAAGCNNPGRGIQRQLCFIPAAAGRPGQSGEMTESKEIAADLAFLRTGISNVYFAGNSRAWILMDSAGPGYADKIRKAAEARFGAESKPNAIVLSHGHFDHAACALELAVHWVVPVYAHSLEFPYLTGKCAYPKKDPTVGGAMAFLSRFFPRRTADLASVLQDLPPTGEVPGIEGWMAIFTPRAFTGTRLFLARTRCNARDRRRRRYRGSRFLVRTHHAEASNFMAAFSLHL